MQPYAYVVPRAYYRTGVIQCATRAAQAGVRSPCRLWECAQQTPQRRLIDKETIPLVGVENWLSEVDLEPFQPISRKPRQLLRK
jgi:hypothetical protein